MKSLFILAAIALSFHMPAHADQRIDEPSLIIHGSAEEAAGINVGTTYLSYSKSPLCKYLAFPYDSLPFLQNKRMEIFQTSEPTKSSYSLNIPLKLAGPCDYRLTGAQLSYFSPRLKAKGLVRFVVNLAGDAALGMWPPRVLDGMHLTCTPRVGSDFETSDSSQLWDRGRVKAETEWHAHSHMFYFNCNDPSGISRPPLSSVPSEDAVDYSNDQLYFSTNYMQSIRINLDVSEQVESR